MIPSWSPNLQLTRRPKPHDVLLIDYSRCAFFGNSQETEQISVVKWLIHLLHTEKIPGSIPGADT